MQTPIHRKGGFLLVISIIIVHCDKIQMKDVKFGLVREHSPAICQTANKKIKTGIHSSVHVFISTCVRKLIFARIDWKWCVEQADSLRNLRWSSTIAAQCSVHMSKMVQIPHKSIYLYFDTVQHWHYMGQMFNSGYGRHFTNRVPKNKKHFFVLWNSTMYKETWFHLYFN